MVTGILLCACQHILKLQNYKIKHILGQGFVEQLSEETLFPEQGLPP